jgi:hypothetical protein
MSRKILEILWLILAILSLGAAIFKTYSDGFRDSYQFFLIFLLAVLIYAIRKQRRRHQ